MSHKEACQLWIEQEIKEGLAQGKTPYAIGKEISTWIKKLWGDTTKPRTLEQRARRQKNATFVASVEVPEGMIAEAVTSLKGMGFKQSEIKTAIDSAIKQGATTIEDTIIKSLQGLDKTVRHETQTQKPEVEVAPGEIDAEKLLVELPVVSTDPPKAATSDLLAKAAIAFLTIINPDDPGRGDAFKQVLNWIDKEAPAPATLYKKNKPPKKLKRGKVKRIKVPTEIGGIKLSCIGFPNWFKKE
jgi:hypothetical protein